MAANRYTKITPSVVKPMSMEEMMMVPMMKQKRHDEFMDTKDLIANELYNQQSLSGDNEMLTGIVDEYKNSLDELGETISNQGVDSNSMRQFQKLYNKYQYDVSEQGKVGKLQSNYKKAQEEAALARKIAIEKGLPTEKVDAIVNKTLSDFSSYDENGNYQEFGSISLPNKYDIQGGLINILKHAGQQGVTIGGSDSNIQVDPKSGMLKVTKIKPGQSSSNVEGIANMLNAYKQSFLSDPDKAAYLDLMDITPEDFNSIVNNTASGMVSTNTVSPTKSSSFMYPRKTETDSEGSSKKTSNEENIQQGYGYVEGDLYHVDDTDNFDHIEPSKLDSKANFTVEDKLKLNESLIKYQPELIGLSSSDAEQKKLQGYTVQATGEELEEMLLDEEFITDGMNRKNGRAVFMSTNGNFLHIKGKYNDKDYNITTDNPLLLRIHDNFLTTKDGREKYRNLTETVDSYGEKLGTEVRNLDPNMSNLTNSEVVSVYNQAVKTASNYIRKTYRPSIDKNSHYREQTDYEILGDSNSPNLGALTTRKVKVYTNDGKQTEYNLSDEAQFKKFTKLVTGNEFNGNSEVDDKINENFVKRVKGAQNRGWTPYDSDLGYTNSINYTLRGHDGNEIHMKVQNNNTIRDEHGIYGLDKGSKSIKYLTEGKIFTKGQSFKREVKKCKTCTENVEQEFHEYYVNLPFTDHRGTRIIPLIISSVGKEYANAGEIYEDLNPENLLESKGDVDNLRIRTLDSEAARVNEKMEQRYRVKNRK